MPERPDYDRTIEAEELLTDFAAIAADYAREYVEDRELWRDSLDAPTPFWDAKYWMLEAIGGRRAISETMVTIQPGGRFRDGERVDVRGLLRWLSRRSTAAHEDRIGDYTETRQAAEAESAYTACMSTIRSGYGVGWPRLNEYGNPMEVDLP